MSLSRTSTPSRIAVAAVGLWLALATGVSAQDRPSSTPASGGATAGEVLIVLASNQPGPVDPRLASVTALHRPPFDSYQSMALLSSPRISLRVGQAQEVPLPNGRRIRIVLQEITREGRFRLRVSINRPGDNDYLPEMGVVASPGDPFFIAGQSFQAGTLVIGIRLGERQTH